MGRTVAPPSTGRSRRAQKDDTRRSEPAMCGPSAPQRKQDPYHGFRVRLSAARGAVSGSSHRLKPFVPHSAPDLNRIPRDKLWVGIAEILGNEKRPYLQHGSLLLGGTSDPGPDGKTGYVESQRWSCCSQEVGTRSPLPSSERLKMRKPPRFSGWLSNSREPMKARNPIVAVLR